MKMLILIFLILLSHLTIAERVNINLHNSYEKDGRNVTLVSIVKDKALVCVNNQYGIISKDTSKTINNVNFILKKTHDNYIKVDVRVYCENCKCDDSCGNFECLGVSEKQIQEEIKMNEQKELVFAEYNNTEFIENKGVSNGSIIAAVLVLFFLAIGIYILIKKS